MRWQSASEWAAVNRTITLSSDNVRIRLWAVMAAHFHARSVLITTELKLINDWISQVLHGGVFGVCLMILYGINIQSYITVCVCAAFIISGLSVRPKFQMNKDINVKFIEEKCMCRQIQISSNSKQLKLKLFVHGRGK